RLLFSTAIGAEHMEGAPTTRFTAARTLVLGGVAALAVFAVMADAVSAAGSAIEPKQHFTGTINGSVGRPHPATIRMACFGPISPGETGHPTSGPSVTGLRDA